MSLRTSACDLPQKLHIVMLVGRAMLNNKFQLADCKTSSACCAKEFTPKEQNVRINSCSAIFHDCQRRVNRAK
jgi:hypothetical protein